MSICRFASAAVMLGGLAVAAAPGVAAAAPEQLTPAELDRVTAGAEAGLTFFGLSGATGALRSITETRINVEAGGNENSASASGSSFSYGIGIGGAEAAAQTGIVAPAPGTLGFGRNFTVGAPGRFIHGVFSVTVGSVVDLDLPTVNVPN